MTFTVPNSKRWGSRGGGIRWGVLCTNPYDGQKELLMVDKCHFYIAEYKEEARLHLEDNIDVRNRKIWKMKIVKLQESYSVIA